MTNLEDSPRKAYGILNFLKDFSVGFVVLMLLGVLFFVLVPLVMLGVKIALWLAVPVVAIIILIALTTVLGHLVTKVRKYQQDRQSQHWDSR